MATVKSAESKPKDVRQGRRPSIAWLFLVGLVGLVLGVLLTNLDPVPPVPGPPGGDTSLDETPRAPRPSPIWSSTFEDGDLSGYSEVETRGSGEEASRTVSSRQARSGSRAARLEMPPSASSGGVARNQSVVDGPLAHDGDEFWYGVSVWIGNSWNLNQLDPGPEEFMNIVGFRWDEDADKYNGPGNGINATRRDDGVPIFASATIVGGPGDSTGQVELGPVVQGQWIDWVMHIKWSTEGDGLREIWRNGEKMDTYEGRTMSRDLPIRHRIGIYQGREVDHDRVLYWDNHRIGKSYAAVDPSS